MLVRLMSTVALAAGLAIAQRGGSNGGGDEGGMGSGGMGNAGGMEGSAPRMQRQTKAEIFMDRLKLKSDQKEEAVKILTEALQKSRPIAEQISRGRQQIGTMILQKKSDEEIKPMLELYTKVYTQMTTLEAETFGKIYATLKPNQQKNAAHAFELMDEILLPAPVGGGRGMGRGQGTGGGQGSERGMSRGGRN